MEIADHYTGDGKSAKGNEMLYLIRKTSILGLLSVLTSLMAIIMISVINIINFWFSMDIIVTTTCIMLLFYRNQPVFSCCCGCLMGNVKIDKSHYSEKCSMGCKLLTHLTIHGNNKSFVNKNESNLGDIVDQKPQIADTTATGKMTLSIQSSNSNNYHPS